MKPTDSDILSAREGASMLGLSLVAVYEGAARLEIPARRVGRRVIFSRRAVEAWVHGGGRQDAATPATLDPRASGRREED